MTTTTSDPRNIYIFFGALLCVALVLVVFVVPIMLRFTTLLEAVTLIVEALGSYFNNPRVVWLGCLAFGLCVIGCCAITVIIAGAFLTCSTASPSAICRLIGR